MSAFVMAETSDRRFEKYNASDGLADNSAQTIYCTKEGRMVITTMGQINRREPLSIGRLCRELPFIF
jgi:hypothetical protein